MGLSSGSRFGPYEVTEKIGEGGMGEVYRATDTNLKRSVAIKVLPASVADDAERLARFQREAEVLAALNHPNIAQIYGLERAGGATALVMELVDGPTLDEMLTGAGGSAPGSGEPGARSLAPGAGTRRALELSEALGIARQIAEALEFAHEQGIIHRDLKPANVKVRPDGTVKVLDFGLAKALQPAGALSESTAALPTITSPAMTQLGMILGTAAYMSPEQARGKAVDKRADVWAFGCVLYEMLTGQRPFEDEDVSLTLSKVLQRDPDFDLLPAAVPPRVRQVVRLCLRKSLRDRVPDIGTVRLALEGAFETGVPEVAAPARPPRRFASALGVALLAIMLVGGVALGRSVLAPGASPVQTFEFDVTLPEGNIESGSFALSPDGSRLALVVRSASGDRQLVVRDMNLTEARVLPGTNGASRPFWSPDGREIAFFAGDQLSRIALDGAAARPVTTVTDPRGGAWAPGDVILIGSGSGPIQRVPASGGKAPEPVTEVETGVEDTHAWPAMLPDGKRFVFLSDASSDEGHRLYVGSLDGGPAIVLRKPVRSQPVVDPSGRLLLGERGQLLAYAFDLESGALSDESTLIATQISPLGNQHELPASASAHGMVAYQSTSPESRLVTVDLAGRVIDAIGEPERYGNATVSPDGRRVAFEVYSDSQDHFVWVQDLERGVRTRLSQGKGADSSAWSPDGQTVYFDSNVSGTWQAYRKSVTGGGEPETIGLPDKATEVFVLDISPDGRWLLGAAMFAGNRYDLYVRSLDGADGAWTPWLAGPAQEDGAAFSPDSRWVAYTSDASGRAEIYLAPFEGGPSVSRWQISSEGGFEPQFSPDGKTIYYRSAAFDWMAVDVRMDTGTVDAGTPRSLFAMPVMELPFLRNLMDVLPDGSGFLTLHPASGGQLTIRVRTGR